MTTISENLQTIKSSTEAIKQAIIDKGGDVTGDITTWADAISGLSGGGSSEEEIDFIGTITIDTTIKVSGTVQSYPSTAFSYIYFVALYMGDMGVYTTSKSICYSRNVNLSLSINEPVMMADPKRVRLFISTLTSDTNEVKIYKVNLIEQ